MSYVGGCTILDFKLHNKDLYSWHKKDMGASGIEHKTQKEIQALLAI